MAAVIEVENLVKRYKELLALDHFNLKIEEGEIFGLLGPNGSGKTTAISAILSLLRYDKGQIRVFGKEMRPDSYDSKRDIGVVLQNVAVFNELTVYENIDYFCGLYIRDKETRKQYVEEAIELVSLGDFRKFYPKKLSGGLLRRLNIACGIAHKPELIILDEPTVAVDPQSRNSILDGIRVLRDRGATILYTTHYMEEVEILCDRIIILDKGKVIASGTTEQLKGLASIEEKVTVEVKKLTAAQLEKIRALPHVEKAEYHQNQLVVTYGEGDGSMRALLDFLSGESLRYNRIYSERPTLNDVFLELTGKELRD